jgi:2',3'-cyclic-nucleotide 2'-phosphodiesterase (5'-nucleotidase family)
MISGRLTNGVLLTQADHFGIHVGRVDLVFDRSSKKLLHRRAHCEYMDAGIRLDHVVMSRAQPKLTQSDLALAEPVGELADTLSPSSPTSEPSDVERLIGASIIESVRDRAMAIDGVIHGVFDDQNDVPPGQKTVNDIWGILPYENFIVTASLAPEEIKMVMEETYTSHEHRSLLGFNVVTAGAGASRRVTSLSLPDGRSLERDKKYVIAFNTFDAQSGGHRFMRLRALLESGAADCRLHDIQTRDALIEYFRRHKVVHKLAAPLLPAAA